MEVGSPRLSESTIAVFNPHLLSSIVANAGLGLVLVYATAPVGKMATAWTWLLAHCSLQVLRLIRFVGDRRALRAGSLDLRRWVREFRTLVLLTGASWGAAPLLFLPVHEPSATMGMAMVILGVCVGVAQWAAVDRWVSLFNVLLTGSPLVLRLMAVQRDNQDRKPATIKMRTRDVACR